MKKLLFIILTILSTSVDAEWTFISKNTLANEYYINLEEIRKIDGYTNFWLLNNYPQKDEHGDLSSSMYVKGDCKNYRMKFNQMIFYPEEMCNGKVNSVLNPENDPENKWIYPPSDSSFGVAMNIACKQ